MNGEFAVPEQGGPAKRIWRLAIDDEPEPLVIRTGISDGVWTEVLDGDVKEGDSVIVGLESSRSERRSSELPPGFGGGRRR